MTPDGYPEDSELKRIKQWSPNDLGGLMEFVEELWKWPERGFIKGGRRRDGIKFTLHTSGWSGNEDIIGALQENTIFWVLCWYRSERGGHHLFRLPVDQKGPGC